MEPAPVKGKLKRLRDRTVGSLLGALVLGMLVPVLLTSVFLALTEPHPFQFEEAMPGVGLPPTRMDRFRDIFRFAYPLSFAAGVFCGPGCMLLAWAVQGKARDRAADHEADLAQTLRAGLVPGAWMSMLNLPAWAVVGVLNAHENPLGKAWVQAVALFLVTGATCGLWLGWQAWREYHPDAGVIPRFSLRTLIALTFAWGVLIMLFIPQNVLD